MTYRDEIPSNAAIWDEGFVAGMEFGGDIAAKVITGKGEYRSAPANPYRDWNDAT